MTVIDILGFYACSVYAIGAGSKVTIYLLSLQSVSTTLRQINLRKRKGSRGERFATRLQLCKSA